MKCYRSNLKPTQSTTVHWPFPRVIASKCYLPFSPLTFFDDVGHPYSLRQHPNMPLPIYPSTPSSISLSPETRTSFPSWLSPALLLCSPICLSYRWYLHLCSQQPCKLLEGISLPGNVSCTPYTPYHMLILHSFSCHLSHHCLPLEYNFWIIIQSTIFPH